MPPLGTLKVFDKDKQEITEQVLAKLAQPVDAARRKAAVQYLVQRCGYTQKAAEAVFDSRR